MEVDLPGMYCDKNGDDQFAVKLRDVDVIPESHYNLISLTKLMEEGYKVIGTKKNGLSVKKGGQVIKFDIRVKTPKGVLWCACWSPNWNEPQTDYGTPRFGILTNPYPNRIGDPRFKMGSPF